MESEPRFTRVKTPTVIQMEAVECGAASLGIILGYYKRFETLEKLRLDCGVSRDGSNALNIKKAARKYGLDVKVFQMNAQELFGLEPPFIVLWNFNHFLVVEGFSKESAYLNDPASGPRKISLDDFKKSYSGIVLTFAKADSFQPGGKFPSIWPGIIERLKGVKAPLQFLLFTAFCVMLTGAIYPAFNKIFFDTIIEQNIYSWSDWFIIGICALTALSALLIWLQQYLLVRLNSKLSISFSGQYLMHILKLPLTFFQQRFGGEIAYRLSLNDAIINQLTGRLATAFITLLFVFVYAILLFSLNVKIAAIVVFLTSLNFLAMAMLQKYRNDAYANLQQDAGKFMGFAIGGLYYIESIKACGGENDFFSKLMGYFNRSLNTEQRLGKVNAFVITLPSIIQMLSATALFGIGGYLMMTENFTIGVYTALQLLMTNLNQPINELVLLGESVQTVKIDMARIDDVMKNPIDPLYKIGAVKSKDQGIKRLDGYLELKDVSFGYSRLDSPFIDNFNFSLKPGQRIALVGDSGCGKTTIGRLISGLLQPWQGEILYDGKPRHQHTREEIVSSLATVDQEIFIFNATIKDNITLFDDTISDDEVTLAAKHACIHDEILQKPGGYSYVLTEGGKNLSGGQKQRIEIARGFLLNPRILVLDEATSALDTRTEETIINFIRQRGCTCVMVAHRLSTIRDCDEIIVMEKGKIVERGTHETLKNVPGIYQQLVLKEI